MARWGEGDPRWIVEERPDATNVNNWHWTERDATGWSNAKLKELFLELKEETDEGKWHIDEVKKLAGEATINNRKGKLIYFYEWNVTLSYKGTVAGSELEHSGTINIPNLSDENSPSDVDVEVIAKGDAKNAQKLKQLVRKNGIKMCREKCAQYIEDIKTEYSTGMVLPTKDGQPINANSNNKNRKNNVLNDNKFNNSMQDMKVTDSKSKNKSICKTEVKLKEEFFTSADELFATLTQDMRLCAFMHSQCTSNPVVGGEFSVMNGTIHGSYVELVPNEKIVQKWRFKEWPEGVFSTVTMKLDQKSDNTVLRLTQSGIPDYDTARTEQGWKRFFWGPMKRTFGYGSSILS